jgi:vancomycin permeability regulator SanA
MLKDRLDVGIALYQAGVAPKLLLSGDNGQQYYNEVAVMLQYALDAGVPAQDIFLDHAGFSTYESMYRAGAVFEVQKAVVVTQGYHLYRALYDARGLGVEAMGVASDQKVYSGQSQRDLREIAARIKDFFMVLAKPEPTFLGEVIPIGGDGRSTH